MALGRGWNRAVGFLITVSGSVRPERQDQLWAHFRWLIRVGVTVTAAPPVHVRERSWNAPTWVSHAQKGRKVILLRVTCVPMQAGQLELRP